MGKEKRTEAIPVLLTLPLTGDGFLWKEAHSIFRSQSEKLLPIGLTGMVHGTDSCFPHVKEGFAKHKKLVIQAKWELPGGGRREEKFPNLAREIEQPCCPSPSQSGLLLCWADKGQLVMLAERWAEGKSQVPGQGPVSECGWSWSILPSDMRIDSKSLYGPFWKVLQGPSLLFIW